VAKIEVTAGVDIGGTNTVLGFVDREGTLHRESSIPTNPQEGPVVFLNRLNSKIDEMVKGLENECELKGIGIGAPNANYYRGTVESPPNLGWKGVVNVVEIMQQRHALPIAITNDANAAAIGEMIFGVAKGMKDFIVITLGTGLGSGVVCNGTLVYGADGFAGEIGHTIVDPGGRQCGCGRRGCLETYASATGICRTVLELLCEGRGNSVLREVRPSDLTAKLIADAARDGDEVAREAFECTGRTLGLKLADSVAHTSPEAIILFGGLAQAGELMFEPTRRHMEENLLNIFKGKVKLLPSGLREANAAVLGASALIWNELRTAR